jgi:NAD(P)H-hydrate epimerase
MSLRSGPTSSAVPVPTGTESRAIDRRSIDALGVPSPALMERAGTHAAEVVARFAGVPLGARIAVVAGGGDNGGDARIVARCLHLWGHDVELLETSSDERTPVLGRGVLRPEPVADLDDALLAARFASADVVVDGMLGTGQSGDLRGEVARVASALASLRSAGRSAPRVVALDVPTGVDADTGAVVDGAVRADLTIAFGHPKLGTLLFPARPFVGRLVVVEIGFPPLERGAATWEALDPRWAASALPERSPRTHKNAAGAVAVIAGSEGMAGAAILAARAALRAGAGYVRVASVASNREAVQCAVPEAVWVEREDPEALHGALRASTALVAGPGMGLGAEAEAALRRVVASDRPLVLDADALTLVAEGRIELPREAPTIATPHPGEAARLLGGEAAAIEADRLAALEALRQRTGAVVLLKGSPTLVAGARRRLDPTGSSDLATAGVGDVLAGTIGALVAQGIEAEDATALGLWLTSSAARIAARGPGLQSADLPDALPSARARLRSGAPRPAAPWILLDLEAPR